MFYASPAMGDDFTASVDPASVAVARSPIELLAPGSHLGDRYEIRRVIGHGGQAVVYLAFDRDLRREVALKVLRPDRSSDVLEKRFRREAAIARDVAHPNVVRIFDIESAGAAVYLTMEHVEGESLRTRIERGPLPIDEVVDFAGQLLHGVQALHAVDIIHRDIKPGNVLISSDGVAKVADFGLARHLTANETKATNTGAILGTIDYLSPEQALGHDIDFRSDLYAAGVVLFEMLTGHVPFAAKSQLGVLLERVKSAAPDVRRERPDCPRWLAAIVARLLAAKPEDRYASATEVMSDLQRRRVAFRPTRRAVAAIVIVLMVIAAGVFIAKLQRPHFSNFKVVPGGIAAVDARGRTLWSLPGIAPDIGDHYAIANVEGQRCLAIINVPADPRKLEHAPRVLQLFDPDSGELKREFDLGATPPEFAQWTDKFVPDAVRAVDLDHDGSDEFVVTFTHLWNWPSFTLLVEPKIRRVRQVFSGSGHHRLAGIGDIDGDGRDDLILAGINNALGWYNALAAVAIDPPVDAHPESQPRVACTPDRWQGSYLTPLIWYALLPRGVMDHGARASVDAQGITYRSMDGSVVRLDRDGLSRGGAPRAGRIAARSKAWEHLREAHRLTSGAAFAAAEDEFRQSESFAIAAGEQLLLEAVKRQHGMMIIASGRTAEGDAMLEQLARSSPNASEIRFDAARALHLRGELLKAASRYIEGLTSGARPDQGKSKEDFIEGAVTALVEAGRFDEAVSAADHFGDAYPDRRTTATFLRQYALWRSGSRPEPNAAELRWNITDFTRTCTLEMRLAAGAPPSAILDELDPAIENRSEISSGALSLHGEVLRQLGRNADAIAFTKRAWKAAQFERARSTWGRALYPLIAERYARIANEKE